MVFDPATDISPLNGKVIIVTGGTDGLGKESVRQLSLHSPACIYLAGRDSQKAQGVLDELQQQHPDHAPIKFLEMDLSSFASVKGAATKFLDENDRLDILMCNAGRMPPPSTTQDGYEMAFGVNFLSHALLTQLLLPILQQTALLPGSDVRVINLSSASEKWAPKHYTFYTMKTDLKEKNLMVRYGQSKLASIHYTSVLAKKHPQILWTSIDPGQVVTNIQSDFTSGMSPITAYLVKAIGSLFYTLKPVGEGANNQLWAATADRRSIENGSFYQPVGVLAKGSARSKDTEMAEKLWTWTEAQLQPFLEPEQAYRSMAAQDKSAVTDGSTGIEVVAQEVHV